MTTQDKIAFITGANRGLGLETARALGRLGIRVMLGSRELAKGEAAAAQLNNEGIANAEAVQFDAANRADHRAIADLMERRFGRLDILVNNAGVSLDDADFSSPNGFNTTSTVSEEVLRSTFETNFFSVVALTQTLLPLILRSPSGRIVNLSSILGSLSLQADPDSPIYNSKAFAYDASKAALNAFTIHLAAQLRETNVKVNSAHPGWVKTEMGGSGADLEVSDGAKTSVALATLSEDGPTGGFFHMGEPLPW